MDIELLNSYVRSILKRSVSAGRARNLLFHVTLQAYGGVVGERDHDLGVPLQLVAVEQGQAVGRDVEVLSHPALDLLDGLRPVDGVVEGESVSSATAAYGDDDLGNGLDPGPRTVPHLDHDDRSFVNKERRRVERALT